MGSKFRELIVWQKAHQLVLDIYRVTAGFPQTEQYCITQQLRKAAYSVPANIAEGCCRKYSAEVVRFAAMSKGSLGEVEYFLLLSRDLGLLKHEEYEVLEDKCVEIARMLDGIYKSD